MSKEMMYLYRVKTFKSGKIGFEQIDEDDIFCLCLETKSNYNVGLN